MKPAYNGIGTLSERSLHASLKDWMAEPGDEIEKIVDGYHIDIVRGPLLIEIQTRNFSAIKRKLSDLIEDHQVRLVHPIASAKWIQRVDKDGRNVSRRKSPRRGRVEHLFQEMIRIPELAIHPNFSVQVILLHEEEIWKDDGNGSWRRKYWSIHDRRLLKVIDSVLLPSAGDYLSLLPMGLPKEFSNRQLSSELKIPNNLARKMTYSLRKMGLLKTVGKNGNAYLFNIAKDAIRP